METLGSYLLQMACWLAGFWLVYMAVLRKETFFALNRWFLLTGLLASLVLPLFPISYDVVKTPVDLNLLKLNGTVTQLETTDVGSDITFWLIAYLAGISFFILRFVWQSTRLLVLRRKSEPLMIGATPVFKLEKDTAPFSFFNSIYISKKMCGETELKTVVAHEKVHIDERHWADLLLLEVARALQWFNPLLILYRKAMMQNHEYLADNGTLQRGVSARTYKAVLANQMLGVPVLQVANGFTLFDQTKRILMMNKNKTKPVKRLKLLWALPVMALIMVAFAKPNYISGEKIQNESGQNSNQSTVKGKIFDQWGNAVADATVNVRGTNHQDVSDQEGNFSIDGAKSTSDFSLSKEGYSLVNKIEKSDDEVVLLAMKSNNKEEKSKLLTIKGKVTDETGKPLQGAAIVVKGTSVGTVADEGGNYNLEGIKSDAELMFSHIGFETKVVKAKSRIDVGMKPTVIPVSAMKAEPIAPPPPPPPPPPAFVLRGKDGAKPLIILDGKVYKGDMNQIDPNTIESIEVLKDQSAVAAYGDEGKDGVIKITLKKQKPVDEQFVIAEQPPVFPGGPTALSNYIEKSIGQPSGKGMVKLIFTVAKDGSVKNAKVVKGISENIDKKALEIVYGMPKWNSAIQNGKPVEAPMSIDLNF